MLNMTVNLPNPYEFQQTHSISLDEIHVAGNPGKFDLSRHDEKDDVQPSSIWCWQTRKRRNISKAFIAGGLSAGGTLLGGFDPSLPGIIISPILSGVGNIASTGLEWQTKNASLIATRMLVDFPLLYKRVEDVDKELSSIIHDILHHISNRKQVIFIIVVRERHNTCGNGTK